MFETLQFTSKLVSLDTLKAPTDSRKMPQGFVPKWAHLTQSPASSRANIPSPCWNGCGPCHRSEGNVTCMPHNQHFNKPLYRNKLLLPEQTHWCGCQHSRHNNSKHTWESQARLLSCHRTPGELQVKTEDLFHLEALQMFQSLSEEKILEQS